MVHIKITVFLALLSFSALATPLPSTSLESFNHVRRAVNSIVVAPKVFIISMFDAEAAIWYENANTTGSIGDLLVHNITVPGFSPRYPQAHCLADGNICQLTTGEAEINAAATMTALTLSPLFDLRSTYFLIAGIAGINPKLGTLADVAFSKYAVQVALQYEIDARELPLGFPTGYVPLGAKDKGRYPDWIYGTEVFSLNGKLRDMAMGFARPAKLNDSAEAIAYRARYASPSEPNAKFKLALRKPTVITCDVATADVFYSGALLSEAFENTTTLFTNGSATYCMSAQEDNAILESLIRAAIRSTVDFSRIILMRAASDFDRPAPGMTAAENLLADPVAFVPSVENLYLAGVPIIQGILKNWDQTFKRGVEPDGYIGDILGTLGGTPPFGNWRGPAFEEGGYKAKYVKANGEITKRRVGSLNWRDRYPGGRVMKGR